ncbi:putative Late embryoproteinsis abundant hydroxyproline-rich glycoprotein family [Hibiscus syriacus]|uniref:Late embryoproteinsis abundant hydroxyproline-rich glycoprotein family n=1 Tax=Hibiscus syriacus TaxID=106335 RepID=A0A6A2WWD5_HIBSY|nr:putative Late embryoproteinsis abundant hydroxyproline-rich glycoprotein family [Hibiscus syriacus]
MLQREITGAAAWKEARAFLHLRFSDGRLMPDFIAKRAKLPLIPPFLQPGFRRYYHGVNFASSGAGALAQTFQGFVIDLKTQLSNYKRVVSGDEDNPVREQWKLLGGSNETCNLHNKALSKLLLELEERFKGFKYSLFDFNSNLRQRMKHPFTYGFKEGETACCEVGNMEEYSAGGGKGR